MKTLSFIITLFFLYTYQIAIGQIVISTGPNITPEDMVENIVGEGITFDNVTFQGADISSGIFTNGVNTNLGLESGIFLTSGDGNLIPGPNTVTPANYNNGVAGHPNLDALATSTTHDAAVLELDLIPASDTLRFKFVFGSEEYQNTPSTFTNDVMGIFVSGPNPNGGIYSDINIATVPGTDIPICVNNISAYTNSEYYIDNTGGLTLQYNGFTVVITVGLEVIPCETYHLKIGIADVGDWLYDSGVFFEENSISSYPQILTEITLDPQGISDQMLEGCVNGFISFNLPEPSNLPYTLHWNFSESIANPSAYPEGDFEEAIPDSVVFAAGVDSVSISVKPVYDGIIEGEESLTFILENTFGCATSYDTILFYITDYLTLIDTISPPTVICEGCEVDLWVNVYDGFPPYSYLWEPGGFMTDTITVSPDTTTTYTVTYTDACLKSGSDSTSVTVFPNVDFETFYFDAAINPGLGLDVFGEVLNDTVQILLPQGTNPNGLIASYTLTGQWLAIFANEVPQNPGITPNDFTNPVTYKIFSPGGTMSEWIVIADVETGQLQSKGNAFSFYPNPANDLLTINFNQPYELSIINSLGQTVFNEQVKNPERNIDLSEFTEGLYFLQLRNDLGLIVRKLIISR